MHVFWFIWLYFWTFYRPNRKNTHKNTLINNKKNPSVMEDLCVLL